MAAHYAPSPPIVRIAVANGGDAEVTFGFAETVEEFIMRLVAQPPPGLSLSCGADGSGNAGPACAFPCQLFVRGGGGAFDHDAPPAVDLMTADQSEALSSFVENGGLLELRPHTTTGEAMAAFVAFCQQRFARQAHTNAFSRSAYVADTKARTSAARRALLDSVPAFAGAWQGAFDAYLSALADTEGDDGVAHLRFSDLCAMLESEASAPPPAPPAAAAPAAAAVADAAVADAAPAPGGDEAAAAAAPAEGAADAPPPQPPAAPKAAPAPAPAAAAPPAPLTIPVPRGLASPRRGMVVAERDALCCAIASHRYSVVERLLLEIGGGQGHDRLARSGEAVSRGGNAPRRFTFAPRPEGWLEAVQCCVDYGTDSMFALLLEHGAPYAALCGRAAGPVCIEVLTIIVGGDRVVMLELALEAMCAHNGAASSSSPNSGRSGNGGAISAPPRPPMGNVDANGHRFGLSEGARETLFYLACDYGHSHTVQWLIDNDWSDVAAPNPAAGGMTALHSCAHRGHVRIAAMLLATAPAKALPGGPRCKAELLAAHDDMGRSPVYISVEKGHTALSALFTEAL